MELRDYISPELLVLVPAVYSVGVILKKSKVKNKYIPAILGAVSIVLCGIWMFASCPTDGFTDILQCLFSSLTQGVLVAAASVYVNQLYGQRKKDE